MPPQPVLAAARDFSSRRAQLWPDVHVEHLTTVTVCHALPMPRVDSASRVVNAEVKRVFAALLDPDQLREWLPPQGMTGRFERFDPRPGGSYRLVLTYEDGTSATGKATADSDIVEARFIEVGLASSLAQLAAFVEE